MNARSVICSGVLSCCLAQLVFAQQGVCVRMADGKLRVERMDLRQAVLANQKGLLIWDERGIDRWTIRLPDDTSPAINDQASSFHPNLSNRSRAATGSSAVASSLATTSLDQLLGQLVFRGEGFLTPVHGGRHIDGRITIRRTSDDGEFPTAEAAIFRGNSKLVTIPFAAGATQMRWADIPDLPVELRPGLAAGTYTLRLEGGEKNTVFHVEDAATRDWMLERVDTLADLLEDAAHPLCQLVKLEELLSARDDDGKPQPYLADALDQIESLPLAERTPHFQKRHGEIRKRLQGQETTTEIDQPTGIPSIDKARSLIARNQWEEAQKLLAPLLAHDADVRTRGLAHLYTAVILSEVSAAETTASEADAHFCQAIALLHDMRDDLFRAHNNYANFLLTRAQDRLYNSAFQAATGVRNPLLQLFSSWQKATDHYKAALELAEKLPPRQRAATEVNLARAHVVISDVLRSLGLASQQIEELNIAEIDNVARDLVRAALEHQPDAMTQAAASDLLAHMALRQNDEEECRRHCLAAQAAYVEIGLLAGVEGTFRSLGILDDNAQASPAQSSRALRELMISQLLAEILRERVADHRSGLSRAGFFARRAYVNERIVESLIKQGNTEEALHFAELAKARALQDVLTTAQIAATSPSDAMPQVGDVLQAWPDDVVALEYFIGSQHGWVFVIERGDVRVFSLKNRDETPLKSSELVQGVTSFLQGMTFTAKKMLGQYQANGEFDRSWQQQLAAYHQTLIPHEVRATVHSAKTLVIIPHHVLHYLPFAALVTEIDSGETTGFETVMPKFLIEQGMAISYAPSLSTWWYLREGSRTPMQQVQAIGIAEFDTAPALPGVELDLKNLKSHFAAQLDKLVAGESATESHVNEALNRRGMLFVATHGMNLADEPLASYLLCHRDADHDGKLTAAEIFNARVDADLVIMSACFTGLADRTPLPGDDLFGLNRAFLSSGAKSVVAGLWDVYDSTGPLLVNQFFQELKQGQPVAAALATAQRSFLQDRRNGGKAEVWIHPYFWAVYSNSGSEITRFKSR